MKPAPAQDAAAIAQEFKDYAYIVSHDFSAPLRAVVEFSKLLKDEPPTGLTQDQMLYLSLIIESGEQMQKMMEALVEYSRLNTMADAPETVDCNTLLNTCQTALADQITSARATIEAADLPAITADRSQLAQLFTLLLSNALTFHHKGSHPHVWVLAERSPEGWVFTFRDNGIGIEPDHQKRIFQPFQRLHGPGEYPGIGMGLTLARKIVERHGGRIWVDSHLGTGASLIFTWPA